MKFKFEYEKLLEYYSQQERIAQRDYSDSVTRLDTEKNRYRKLYQDHDDAIERSFLLQTESTAAPVELLKEIDRFIDGTKIRIERQRQVVINHTQIVEQKQEILIAAAKERKIFERLKEKRLIEFRKAQKKKENKLNDEVVVTRFRRGESA